MVPTQAGVDVWSATEFSKSDHECAVEQSTLLEIIQQR